MHLLGWAANYPGQIHARIMAHGLFGGFIFGFLGTAMPRMLSAPPLRGFETGAFLLTFLAMVSAYALAKDHAGNILFLILQIGFIAAMSVRFRERKDTPPPGFILVGLSFLCAAAGAFLSLFEVNESSTVRDSLQRLLTYQGFVLLPILGIGPFILPRFFGLPSPHDFPETRAPNRAWVKKATLALVAGGLIIWSFFLEAKGSTQIAYGLRFGASLAYMLFEMPLKAAPGGTNVFGAAIRLSIVGILSGFLSITFFPAYRVGLLHLTLIGGFAVITFVVATRVLFGHSGNLALLKDKNRWLLLSLGLMLFGMATRISGDFWPRIMASHYIYGALLWIFGALVWAAHSLPKVLFADETERR